MSRYVKVNGDGSLIDNYSLSVFRKDNNNISFPSEISEETLADYGVFPVQATDKPTYDSKIEKVIELDPTETTPGVWVQTWQVVDLTAEEIEKRRNGVKVTMRQARLALLEQGLLANIESSIAALPDGDREKAQIEWEYGSAVERNSPWVVQLTAGMGMTPEQVDSLFDLAATL